MNQEISELLKRLNIQYKDEYFYKLAFSHSSLNKAGTAHHQNYERLEFLGDSLVGFVVSDLLIRYHPEFEEGQLASLKGELIKSASEAKKALSLGLDKCIMFSSSLSQDFMSNEPLLEDVFEAFVGAVLLDQGLESAIKLVTDCYIEDILTKDPSELENPKTLLQEYMQSIERRSVVYKVIKTEGPSHARIFTSGVYFDDHFLAEGTGKSIRISEFQAASNALEKLAIRKRQIAHEAEEVMGMLSNNPEYEKELGQIKKLVEKKFEKGGC
ncbi:MAG: ribonuclease III [Bacilli bacterium]|nr:ribonuclease III [Bacilli bacterium]